MSKIQKAAVIFGFFATLAVGSWIGYDFSKYSSEWYRCKAVGGDGLTNDRKCFKRQMIDMP